MYFQGRQKKVRGFSIELDCEKWLNVDFDEPDMFVSDAPYRIKWCDRVFVNVREVSEKFRLRFGRVGFIKSIIGMESFFPITSKGLFKEMIKWNLE